MTSLYLRITTALNALGANPDDVADTLLAGGWTGLREDGLNCPISNYLTAVLPDIEAASVTFDRVKAFTVNADTLEIPLPRAASRFVDDFDGGAYDDLAAVITRHDGEVIDDLER